MTNLADCIRQAQECYDSPPPNEATTCAWIIHPILLEAGYARRDILCETLDNNSQFPDYTILPGTPQTWVLEAKQWKTPLQDGHAQQSLNCVFRRIRAVNPIESEH